MWDMEKRRLRNSGLLQALALVAALLVPACLRGVVRALEECAFLASAAARTRKAEQHRRVLSCLLKRAL